MKTFLKNENDAIPTDWLFFPTLAFVLGFILVHMIFNTGETSLLGLIDNLHTDYQETVADQGNFNNLINGGN